MPGFHLVFPGSLQGWPTTPVRSLSIIHEVDPEGLEPSTPTMPLWCAPNCATGPQKRGVGGAEGTRTPDLYSAIVALSQLSYSPGRLTAKSIAQKSQAVKKTQAPGPLARRTAERTRTSLRPSLGHLRRRVAMIEGRSAE